MKKIVPFLILILVAIQASAQRQTDLQVTVTSPQNGALLLPNVSTVFATLSTEIPYFSALR